MKSNAACTVRVSVADKIIALATASYVAGLVDVYG